MGPCPQHRKHWGGLATVQLARNFPASLKHSLLVTRFSSEQKDRDSGLRLREARARASVGSMSPATQLGFW